MRWRTVLAVTVLLVATARATTEAVSAPEPVAGPSTATTITAPGFTTPGFTTPGFTTPGFTTPGFITPGFITPGFTTTTAGSIRPTTTTTLPPTTTTTTPPRSFTLAFTGDMLLHSRVNAIAAANAAGDDERDWDYRPMLEPISSLVEAADRAICHLEVNLSADGTRLSSYPSFRAPGQVAFDLADLGYDSCTLASNHILDKGLDGVAETLGVLDAAGIHPIGAARSPAEAERQRLFTVQDVMVAHLAYTYWFNGIPLPEDAPWTSNVIDEDRILADATRARRDGAEYIVVSLHWGQQYQHQPDRQQRDLGPRLLASPDIDLIIGHHAHVVQPIEQIDGEWLVFGLGNLLSNSSQVARRDELLVTATINEGSDGRFTTDLTVTPLHLDHTSLTVHPTNPALRPASTGPGLAGALDASWNRVINVLTTDRPNLEFDLG